MPNWEPSNLISHYQRHPGGRDAECWKNLLNRTEAVSEEEYAQASLEAIHNTWIQYEARWWNVQSRTYDELRLCYVDDRLVFVVTDLAQEAIITCYHDHKHSGGKHLSGENVTIPVLERRERYRRLLRNAERGKQVIDLRIIYAK